MAKYRLFDKTKGEYVKEQVLDLNKGTIITRKTFTKRQAEFHIECTNDVRAQLGKPLHEFVLEEVK